jgi:hypothetical protein
MIRNYDISQYRLSLPSIVPPQEILLEQGRGFRNSSDLVVNDRFDFDGLMNKSFARHFDEFKKSIDPLKPYIRKGLLDKIFD